MSIVRRFGTGPSLFRETQPAPRNGGAPLIWIAPAIVLALLLAVPAFA